MTLARRGGHVFCRREIESRLARSLGDRRARDVRLEAAAPPAAAAGPAVPVDGHVAELAAVPARAAVEPAVDHDAAADARRDGEVDEVADPGAGAPEMLARGRGRRVVLER